MNYKEQLEAIDRKLGRRPRKFGLLDKLTWYKQDLPSWDWQDDDIRHSVQNWEKVFQQGRLGWGYIVQANTLMFEKGPLNCPGEILIWQDEAFPFDPEAAGEVARRLYELKGNSAHLEDEEERRFAAHLEDELERSYGLQIPERIADGFDLKVSTIFFQRRHIPGGVVTNSFFPILYLETNPMVTVMVPHRFWPKSLLEEWNS